MRKAIAAVLCVLFLAGVCLLSAPRVSALEASASGSVYYLSEAGSDDNSGFEAAPWRTFERANKSVKAGDTVRVLAGHYEGAKLTAKGTAGKPITYISVESRKAIIDLGGFPPSSSEGSRISIWGDYTIFDGFEVSTGQAAEGRAANAGVAVYRCTGVTVRNCHSHTNDRWGIFTAWAADLTLENNECHNNRREHGIYVSNGGDNPHVVGNTCYNNGGCGIQIKTDGGTIHGAVLEKNLLYDNNKVGGQSINFDGVAQAIVRNNVVIINRRSGIALYKIDGGEVPTANVIVNNTFVNVGGSSGILLNDDSHGNIIFNNVLWSAKPTEMMEGNIAGNTIAANAFGPGATFGEKAVTLSTDLAAYFAAPDAKNFRLKADSALIDMGLGECGGRKAPGDDFEGVSRPQGGAPDIGAFEYAK
mgnify:CR=1 FL=1